MQVEPARFAEAGIVRLPKPWPQAYDPVRGWSVRAAQTKPETEAIVKNGFKVMDSDLHTMEPDGLWERYLAEPFKKFASRFLRSTDNAPNQPLIKIGDLEIGEMSRTPSSAKTCITARSPGIRTTRSHMPVVGGAPVAGVG